MKRYLLQMTVFSIVAVAYLFGGLDGAERALMEARFELSKRDVTGNTVVVAIDARSLRQLDTWPWPRGYHARLIDRLAAAGAKHIALDIDFSARSTPKNDRALAQAIRRVGGRVILPVFKQTGLDRNGNRRIFHNEPLPQLRQGARLAMVNVRGESGGKIWRYTTSDDWRGRTLNSLAGELAGPDIGPKRDFYIDYGIRAEAIPQISYVDVMRGNFDPRAFEGKTVIVGATAVELGDQFAVPVYGILPGTMVQALALESLAQGREIKRSGVVPVLLLILAMVLALGPRFAGWSWQTGSLIAAGSGIAIFLATVAVQDLAGITADGVPLILALFFCYAIGLWSTIDRQASALYRQRIEALHRRAMMNSVVEDSFDGIVIADHEGNIELMNSMAGEILGRDAEDMTGTDVHPLLPWSAEIEALYDYDGNNAASSSPAIIGPQNLSVIRYDGEEISIDMVVRSSRLTIPRHALDTRPTRRWVHIYTFRDITQRKLSEQAKEEAMRVAVTANRAKTEFLTNMSHELRTPLNAIIGFAELIDSEAMGKIGVPAYKDYISDIHDSGKHLLSVINDILDMSKIEAGEMKLSESEIDIARVVASSLRLVADRAEKSGLSIDVDIPDDLPLLHGDERMVKQVLLNLLSNAVKFTPDMGEITVKAWLDRAGSIALSVADTGIGIAPEDIDVILKPFGQADGTLNRSYEGTGLGLPLVNSMMKLHNGSMTLDSTPGAGTTVRILFPASRTITSPTVTETVAVA